MNKEGPRWNVTVRGAKKRNAAASAFPPDTLPILALNDALVSLTHRDDGWLRVVPQDFGKVVFYKWKFTSGKWSGYYVMWRDDDESPVTALCGLLRRIYEAYAGEHMPVLDRAYS